MAVEGPLALSIPEDTAGEDIPRVDTEPGSRAPDRSVSAPRGVVASREVVAAASDGGMLVTTRKRRDLPHFRVCDFGARKVAPPPPLYDAVPTLETPLSRYIWR